MIKQAVDLLAVSVVFHIGDISNDLFSILNVLFAIANIMDRREDVDSSGHVLR